MQRRGVFKATAGYTLEVNGRDDLIGIDIATTERNSGASVCNKFFHRYFPLLQICR